MVHGFRPAVTTYVEERTPATGLYRAAYSFAEPASLRDSG